jgi:PhzF family phenazine biosynthesis protein
MRIHPYRIVNAFAESVFGGNPLCVFESGVGLADAEMQALALQFNLSETTFIMPAEGGTACVRIFTPTFEMAFAGHPTLGSAHVVCDLLKCGDSLTLDMKAGRIPVSAAGDVWTLTANAPSSRDPGFPRARLAAMLGLDETDVLDGARWINTGSDQLIVPLASPDAVRRAAPVADQLRAVSSDIGRSMAYIFAHNGSGKLLSRFFFMKHSSIIEDPGTGSATANLGGWFLSRNEHSVQFAIEQGAAVNRPCHLGLKVDAEGRIYVSGRVIEIGRGEIRLP